jgi:phage-related protein
MKIKPLIWIGSSLKDLRSLPEPVKDEIGFALHQAQLGGKSNKAKAFKGFSGASVMEIVERSVGDTYRALYTVRFEKAIAVLHVFKKKSKHGIETPKQDVDLIKSRFKLAEEEYKRFLDTLGE